MVTVLVAVMLSASALMLLLHKKNQPAGNDMRVDLHALKIPQGWGYEVLVDKKVFIHQDCIPAIASFKKFGTEAEALLIGSKVVEKIKKGHNPSVTQQDIRDAHIHF